MKNHLLSGGQIRAARALLRWSVEQFAREASSGRSTIKRAEDRTKDVLPRPMSRIRRAFEGAGVEFINGH